VELLGPDQRGDGALQPDHPADQEVHYRQQHELGEVLPKPEPYAAVGSRTLQRARALR
jgi:hypothetical protein